MGNKLGTTGVFNVLKVGDLLFYIFATGWDMIYLIPTFVCQGIPSILQGSTAPRPRVSSL